MKKLKYRILPCVFCTIGLNSYVASHNLVHAAVQKLTNNIDSSTLKDQSNTTADNTPTPPL